VLVDVDLLEAVPPDLETLGALWPQADVDLQEESPWAFHPTLTRVWCWQGRRGPRLGEALGAHDQVYGFSLVDWCEGWFDGRLAPGRTADIFGAQVRAAVTRAHARGRMALVIVDNLRTHTPAYDPDANRIEWVWRWSRREGTHNQQRTTFAALLEDIQAHFETLRQHSALVLRQIGRPFADQGPAAQPLSYAACFIWKHLEKEAEPGKFQVSPLGTPKQRITDCETPPRSQAMRPLTSHSRATTLTTFATVPTPTQDARSLRRAHTVRAVVAGHHIQAVAALFPWTHAALRPWVPRLA